MSALAQLNINDLRPRLTVKANPAGFPVSRRPRRGPVKGVVLHYNGPRVSFFPNPARELDFVVRVDCPNHQQRIGGDSLMYHFVVLSDGSIWQSRNLEYIAWHAGHAEPNEHYLAIHLPLGGDQDATPAQWAAVEALIAALRIDYGFGRAGVTGHREWAPTACPGRLMPRVLAYRAAQQPTTYQMKVVASVLNVRQGPTASYPVAGTLKLGDIIECDATKDEGQGDWHHLYSGLGFVSGAWVERI